MRIRMIVTAAALAAGLAAGAQTPAPGDARAKSLEFQKKALEAYQKKDWPGFLANMRQAEALRPGVPRLVYNVACAEARNGHAAEAAKRIETLLDRKMDFGSDKDDDFAGVAGSPEFAGVRRKLEELRRPVGGSAVAFRLPEKDLLTEGIAYDPKSDVFYVSSVHKRKILRRAADGRVSDFVRSGQDGLLGVLGIAIDPKTRRLYACSAALPQMEGYEKKLEASSGVLAFELATGKLAGRWTLPGDGPKAPGDIAVAENGDVYVTDGLGSGVYRIRVGRPDVEVFVAPGVFRSPQGVGFGPRGEVYIADYVTGLFRMDAQGKPREVASAPDVPLVGIDALLVRGRTLYVTQNGIAPERVARLELDDAGERVVRGEILDMNDPEFAEPTLATTVGSDLFVVGKSQWGFYDEKTGTPAREKLQEPAILRVRTAGEPARTGGSS